MAYFGVDKHVRVKEQILQFQNIIRNRMTTSVRSLKSIFAQMDTNQSGARFRVSPLPLLFRPPPYSRNALQAFPVDLGPERPAGLL